MRVTQNMLNTNFLRNLNNINRDMEKTQDMLSSGKRFRLPQDDPVGTSFSMYYRSSLSETQKYTANADESLTWMENTDTALGEANDVLQRVRELVLYASNDTLSSSDREAIAKEVDQLREHMSQIANTTIGGRYIFGGTNTKVPPSSITSTTEQWQGNDQTIQIEVGQGILIPINSIGEQVFAGPDQNTDIFGILRKISDDMKTGTGSTVAANLGNLDAKMEVLLSERASLGARVNRMELTKSRLEDLELSIQTVQSTTEDADIAKTITDLNTQQNVLRSALGAGARILQPSLLDFLN